MIFSPPYYGACSNMGNDYTEALLTEARNAIDKTDQGECNAGFIRSEAMLIILVSDEPEQSEDITGETWQMVTDQIIAKRGSAGLVRISSIVGDVPSGCQSGGWFWFQCGSWNGICGCYELHQRSIFKYL